ncbi:MAG: PEP-utilizing enzyme [Candidatus Staskawiczbacteria bacterium]|jgi:phosphoenolpyruvate synthase/pyruvate phosphate dikinase
MEKHDKLLKAIRKDRYIQGCNAVPLLISSAGYSGFAMKKNLGFGYNDFLFVCENEYAEMCYLNSDLERLWKIIKNKIIENPDYLQNCKTRYEKVIKEYHSAFEKIYNDDFKKMPDQKLLKIFKKSVESITYAVGVGHIIEPIGLKIEDEFKAKLFDEISEKNKLNQYFSELSIPSSSSFIAKEEDDLEKISKLPAKAQKIALQKHLQKYFWVQNSYAGAQKLNIKFFEKRLRDFKKQKIQKKEKAKNDLIRELKLSSEIKKMIEIIDFTTIWQDERKANVLKSISYTNKAAEEIARRIKTDTKTIFYLGPVEVASLKSLKDIKRCEKELKLRAKGTFLLIENGKDFFVSGRQYKELLKEREKLTKSVKQTEKIINGSIANGGTAIGRVVVCKNLSDMKKVRSGDVLVTSMTRPEYMSAIKKAAAIVTDEGGITSHAAIVSRELNIPAVIGTKMATKILKDGMIVEVRANHGFVKIIK